MIASSPHTPEHPSQSLTLWIPDPSSRVNWALASYGSLQSHSAGADAVCANAWVLTRARIPENSSTDSAKRDSRATSSTDRTPGRRTVIFSQQFAHVPLWLVNVTLSKPRGFHAVGSERGPEPPQRNPSGTRKHAAKTRSLNTNHCKANTSFGWVAARSTGSTAGTTLAPRNRDTCS